MKLFRNRQRGFTLIELLIVIAIIAILAAVVLIAINPARQFAQAANSQRSSNILTIINAVHQYTIDNGGVLPAGITTTSTPVCKLASPVGAGCANLANLGSLSYNQTYLANLPLDPSCPASCGDSTGAVNANSTGYRIYKSSNGRVTVFAPNAQLSQVISITR